MWSWDLKNDKLLSKDLGFTKCGDMDTGNRPFIDTSTSAYYIDLPYGYISLKDTAEHRLYSGNCLGGFLDAHDLSGNLVSNVTE